MAEKLCELKKKGGGKGDNYDVTYWQSVSAGAIATIPTQGRAKAIYLTRFVSGNNKSVMYTNVNPTTGVIDNTRMWQADTASNTWYEDANTYPIISDNSVTFSRTMSSGSNYKVMMGYTY